MGKTWICWRRHHEAPAAPTLHEEIQAILRSNGNRWMTTQEIAEQVARRRNYRTRDGTSNVSAFQVHGRTKNYPQLFERDGQRVHLLED